MATNIQDSFNYCCCLGKIWDQRGISMYQLGKILKKRKKEQNGLVGKFCLNNCFGEKPKKLACTFVQWHQTALNIK